MESFLENLFAWLPEGWLYYTLIFSVTLAESIVLIGLLVPGSTLIVFSGFIAAHGKGDLTLIILASVAGAFLGDLISYVLGGRTGPQLRHSRIFKKRLHLIWKAELFFASHGGKSLFFGRFMGPLRGMMPFVAGCTRLPLGSFLGFTLVSSILWGIAYPGLGFLGAASWQKLQRLTGKLSLLIGFLLVLFILNGLFWKKLFPRLVNRVTKLWPRIAKGWASFLNTPAMSKFADRYPRLWTFLAGRFSLKRGSGLYLTVGFSLSVLFSGVFFWLVEHISLFHSVDHQIYQLLSQYSHPLADRLMIMITSLADGQMLLLITGVIFLWLVLNNRDFSAVILLGGMGGGQALVVLLKIFYQRTRPLPFVVDLPATSYSFPSAHAFSAMLLTGLLVYFLLGTIREWPHRLGLLIGASFLALLIGLSRCYLGIHWFSDVIAGFVLGIIWLTFLITALEIRRRFAGEFPWRTGWEPVRISFRLRRLILLLAFFSFFSIILYHLLVQAGLV
jgi:undecaprenyl-diphosphatase